MTPEQIATLRTALVGQTWADGAWTCTEVRDIGHRCMVWCVRTTGDYLDLAGSPDADAMRAAIAAQVAIREADIAAREAAEAEAAALAELMGEVV